MEDIAEGDQSVFGESTVDDYCKKVMGAIRACQKSSSELQGWYHYGDYSGVQKTMTRVNHLLHNILGRVYKHQELNISLRGHKLQEQFDVLREGNDVLLERINCEVDEASGFRRNTDIEMFDATVRTIRAPTREEAGREMVLLASRNVQKPQMFFEQKVNNSPKEPFVPMLKEKPHSLKPLSILPCIDEDGREFYPHPYEYELQRWVPHESAFQSAEPIKPGFLPDTPLLFVDNEQTLSDMVDELKDSTEIAIDVEAHSFRSYLGLTCLIQLSTRSKDYVVDTLALRGKLTPLNEVFANPKVIKVLHGADFDILWLQRDCGLYIVNMFDTHQASIILELPHRSLGALLNKYCNVHANKIYQRADWRIRPLPEDFIAYARQDTHYLLYIYDILRNDLINRGNELHNLISACYSRSTELCLQRFEKPYVGPESHLHFYRKSRKFFNSRQLQALKDLFLWRDKVAREQDESVEYVLPKHMMLQMAELLPKEMQGILACCNPIPIFVKTDQLTLHQIIRHAREQPLTEVTVNVEQSTMGQANAEEEDLAHILLSKHDLSMVEHSSSAGLSTLLNPQETLTGDLFSDNNVNVRTKKKSSLFGKKKVKAVVSKRLYQQTPDFQSPFHRYLLYIELQPQISAQQKEQEKREQERIERDDRERIDSIKEHFLSLQKVSTPSKSAIDEDEQARISRLIAHVSASVRLPSEDQEVSSVEQSRREKKKNTEPEFPRESILDKIAAIRSLVDKDPKSGKKREAKEKRKGKKRKSGTSDGHSKKVKTENNDEESDENNADSSVQELSPKRELEDGEIVPENEEIEAFDYTKADYDIFKSKKTKHKHGKGFREKFKVKGGRQKCIALQSMVPFLIRK